MLNQKTALKIAKVLLNEEAVFGFEIDYPNEPKRLPPKAEPWLRMQGPQMHSVLHRIQAMQWTQLIQW